MARIETWYRCPVCKGVYGDKSQATACRNRHEVMSELWAVGKEGKAVRVNPRASVNGYGGINWALGEADRSDRR